MSVVNKFKEVKKRDGRIVPFDQARITTAIAKAMEASGEGDAAKDAPRVSDMVVAELNKRYPPSHIPHIEEIQDVVEESLILMDFPKVAKAYILYRQKRAEVREKRLQVPERVKKLALESKQYFRNPLAEFIYYRSYSRWIEEEGRRETWIETVGRYINYMKERLGTKLSEDEYEEIRMAILKQDVMPSMRLLWSAGKAVSATNVSAYNCSFTAAARLEDFAEIMYLLMCGTGVGFSVENQFVQQLPIVKRQTGKKLPVHVIEDSKEGWADALTLGLKTWYEGNDITFDYSRVRPAGARLKTMGGRSSGPGPLKSLLDFSRAKILSRQGKRLTSLDVHDIICKLGEVVVMGGVRRSALISLSDLDDDEMRLAKTGQFYITEPQRSMANNSAVYNAKPSATQFLEEWFSLAKSGTGERGIFNRGSLPKQFPERRKKIFDRFWDVCGTNPCGEIILRPKEFCNLTEVVARPEDTEESLMRKIRLATILGTYQATLTDFPYLSREWKENCEEERLLGVSITGQWDSPQVRNPETLRKLKEHAIEINQIYAKRFGINPSMAITCVKPSGCRPWYALTTTTDGLLTLEELFDHHDENRQWDEFGGRAQVIQNPHPAKILKTYQNSFDRLLRITMNYGLAVESTPNHPWFVSYHYDRSRGKTHKKISLNNWVEARNLRIGDVLELKLGVYSKTDPFRLEKLNSLAIKMRGDVTDIRQPDYMNQDLAWFLGYLWGDGALSPAKFRIRFVDQYKENLEKAARVLKEQFGIDSTLRKASGHRKAYTLEVGSKMLWHWLIKNNVFKYYADRIDLIPRCIRASRRDDIIAFMAGLLDSDGWVGTQSNKNGYTLILTTSDPLFAQHLQDVAWAVGLGFGRSLNSKGNNLQKKKQMYLLTLGRYVDPDAFGVLAENSNKIQTAIKRDDFKGWLWQNKKSNTLIAGKIIKIEEVGVVPTYDIEVENHWYYAGCVKSHNTVSQLVDSSSGMHPRHSRYYIRRVRISATDPLFHMLREQKFPYHPEVGQLETTATTFVLEFPVASPPGAVVRNDLSAIDQLEHWKMVKLNYTEHNPSVTVSVGENEWIETADWLYDNWEILGGLSFLPREEHVYQLAPYEEISEEKYKELAAEMPEIDFSSIMAYEKEDMTSGSKELACVGNVCEVDFSELPKSG